MPKLSFIIPSKNEATTLPALICQINELYLNAEIIIVNDGSTDNTRSIVEAIDGNIICINHPYSKGNGAAIKTGARAANGDIFIFMDADGQHNPADAASLLDKLDQGFDLAVGARSKSGQANWFRNIGNQFYNHLASWVSGTRIDDLTSGFRAVRSEHFKKILYLLPNGFSYPTTSTMAFLKLGYNVTFVPINVAKRVGKSHISIIKDGIKFLLIIFKIATLYSPMRLFFPISLSFFLLGSAYYLYTFFSEGRFTNMGALLWTTSLLIFLIGLVSEQITTLIYKDK